MDRKEDERKSQEEVADLKKQVMKNDSEVDYDKLREAHRQITQKTLDSFDNLIKSWWIWGDTKFTLQMSRAIVADHAKTRDGVIYLLEYCDDLRKAVLLLYDAVNKLGGATQKEVATVKSRLNAILENPAVKELGKVLTDTEELMAKKDKNRRQILRDSIV